MKKKYEIKVCNTSCDQCLFTKNKIVTDERKAEILKDLEVNEQWFICHKSPDNESGKHMCYGWYLRFAHILPLTRLAMKMGMLKMVEVPKPKY